MAYVFGAASGWHAAGAAPCANPGSNFSTVTLVQYYSASRDDHYATASGCFECDGLYVQLGNLADVYANCVAGALPLSTYYSEAFQDNALLLGLPTDLPGYAFVRVEGFVLPVSIASGSGISAEAILSTIAVNSTHADFWAVLGQGGLANATAAGYTLDGSLGDAVTGGAVKGSLVPVAAPPGRAAA